MPATPLNAVPVSDELDELDSRVRTIGAELEQDSDAHLLLGATGEVHGHSRALLAGRYRLLRHLDRGATADVYLAEDTFDGSEVVAKILDAKATGTEDLRTRFVVGARAAMRIRHPNVVRIYAAEDPAELPPYSIMEVLEGETLGHLFRRGEPLHPMVALRLSQQLASGLHAVHQAGIVHRDVKPDNIFLVGEKGAPKAAKILDFGLAKCDPQREENVVLGTGQYMAPEQVLGDHVDARSDVYSLGVVMFRMFTDHLPWDLELGVELLRHHLVSPAPPPSWLNESLDPRIEVVILRALSKHPENRFASMQELAEELNAILADAPPIDPPPAYRPSRLPDLYTPCTTHARENAALLNVSLG